MLEMMATTSASFEKAKKESGSTFHDRNSRLTNGNTAPAPVAAAEHDDDEEEEFASTNIATAVSMSPEQEKVNVTSNDTSKRRSKYHRDDEVESIRRQDSPCVVRLAGVATRATGKPPNPALPCNVRACWSARRRCPHYPLAVHLPFFSLDGFCCLFFMTNWTWHNRKCESCSQRGFVLLPQDKGHFEAVFCWRRDMRITAGACFEIPNLPTHASTLASRSFALALVDAILFVEIQRRRWKRPSLQEESINSITIIIIIRHVRHGRTTSQKDQD